MTSFVNVQYSQNHQGADRVESAVEAAKQVRKSLTGVHGLATLLLSALAAAAMLAADQLMESAAEGHLMAMWITLWAVAFVALASFAGLASQLAERLHSSLDEWSRGVAQARSDQRLWGMARQDARVMADLQTALLRSEAQSEGLAANASTLRARRVFLQAPERSYL